MEASLASEGKGELVKSAGISIKLVTGTDDLLF
jgi:hypothetical protein